MAGHLVARAYLAAGWSVVPVTPGQKHPPLLKWQEFENRRPTPEEIADWWQRWPDANVAIVTGRISDLSVIDVDAGSGGLDSLKESGHRFPQTRVHKTPAGFHLLFHYSEALHTGAGFLTGIDVRSDGGYIIAPPSVSQKGQYTVLRDGPPLYLTEIPSWLGSHQRQARRERVEPQDDPEWVQVALRGVGEKQRNATAARLVGYFHGRGTPRSAIEIVMRAYARACTPPMELHELTSTIDSVTRYPTTPRQGFVRGLWNAGAIAVGSPG